MNEGDRQKSILSAEIPSLGGLQRRPLLLGSLLTLTTMFLSEHPADASTLDPAETQITLPDAINWSSWSGLPKGVGDMARLYGDLNAAGPYLVLMRWHPGYMSAPHTYATDRLSLVLSGTWWVNSGSDFRLCSPCRRFTSLRWRQARRKAAGGHCSLWDRAGGLPSCGPGQACLAAGVIRTHRLILNR
jgi:hypothetical protein